MFLTKRIGVKKRKIDIFFFLHRSLNIFLSKATINLYLKETICLQQQKQLPKL